MNNALYLERYGAWAGNTNGHRPDHERCCVEVSEANSRWPHYYQCRRKRGFGPDEAYCKQHDPAAVVARAKASNDAYNAKTNKERYRWHGRTFYEALKQIAEGHNDARGLAQSVIEEFHAGERK